MAMLAEPRRKKRSINLRGKNNWSDDQNKFGQKLMEKMGWAPGKGLGMNEDGSVDHIKVRFKDDNGGVGFKDRNDQWTEHETNFNGLLQALHGGNVDTTKLHSETSLEEKSKKLQYRVHYQKFTRGKDISRYSAKDLANIFGKKTLSPKAPKAVQVSEEEVQEEKEEESPYKLVAGGSMKDYFNSKLKGKLGMDFDTCDKKTISDDENCDVVFRGFSGTQSQEENKTIETNVNELYSLYSKNSNFMKFSRGTEDILPLAEDMEVLVEEGINEKKKKRKNGKCKDIQDIKKQDSNGESTISSETKEDVITDDVIPKKTKKKSKQTIEDNKDRLNYLDKHEMTEDVQNILITDNVISKKKKKKSKETLDENNDNNDTISMEVISKKKRKRKRNIEAMQVDECNVSIELPQKKKKSKNSKLDIVSDTVIEVERENVLNKKGQKKNKFMQEEELTGERICDRDQQSEEKVKKKKKNKK